MKKADSNQEEQKTQGKIERLKIESGIIKKVADSKKLQRDEKLLVPRSLVQIKTL